MRWGRSLWEELTSTTPLSVGRLTTLLRVLWAGASDPDLRDAKQFRAVRLVGDDIELDVDPSWRTASRAVNRLEQVSGVGRVRVRGAAVQPTLVDTTSAA
jgi:hypothetical protein